MLAQRGDVNKLVSTRAEICTGVCLISELGAVPVHDDAFDFVRMVYTVLLKRNLARMLLTPDLGQF